VAASPLFYSIHHWLIRIVSLLQFTVIFIFMQLLFNKQGLVNNLVN
jgi:hypothetical protein